MDVFSMIVAAVTVAVVLQAALVAVAVACMAFAAGPAALGWVVSRLVAPMMTPTR